jgi:tetratricopeptide (TPR) repeat protein
MASDIGNPRTRNAAEGIPLLSLKEMLPRLQRALFGGWLLVASAAAPAAIAQQPPNAAQALNTCKQQSDAGACRRAIRLGLTPKEASEAYTFWADRYPIQFGQTDEPLKLLRKAVQLDPKNALATYLLASYLPTTEYKSAEENEELLRHAAEMRPDWEGPHVLLAGAVSPFNYDVIIREWTGALKLAPDDPSYAAKLKQAQEDYAARKRDFEEKETKAKADPQA